MNLHKHYLMSALIGVAVLALAGCGPKSNDSRSEAGKSEAGVSYSAKHGLLVPPETAKFIGLEVADVEERKIAATLRFSAQIYRAASEAQFASLQPSATPTALASGSVGPEEAIRLSEGQTVSVLSADGGVALPGLIITVKRDLEKTSGQVEVLLAIADAPQPLAAGAFVSVTVPLGGEKPVASVPRSAVIRTVEGDCVYTVNGDYFARTAVKLGLTNGEFTEVTEGLFAGDKVVVHPVMTLWMTELHNVKGGDACCIAPAKGE